MKTMISFTLLLLCFQICLNSGDMTSTTGFNLNDQISSEYQ